MTDAPSNEDELGFHTWLAGKAQRRSFLELVQRQQLLGYLVRNGTSGVVIGPQLADV